MTTRTLDRYELLHGTSKMTVDVKAAKGSDQQAKLEASAVWCVDASEIRARYLATVTRNEK